MFWALHVGTEWGPILSVIVLLYFILYVEVEWNKQGKTLTPSLLLASRTRIFFEFLLDSSYYSGARIAG